MKLKEIMFQEGSMKVIGDLGQSSLNSKVHMEISAGLFGEKSEESLYNVGSVEH